MGWPRRSFDQRLRRRHCKANFYHHVDSKEELLYEIFVDTLQYSLSHIQEIIASEQSIPDQLRALVAFYVSLMLDRRAVMLVWFKERAHLTEAHQKEVVRLEQEIGALLERFYASGMKTGDFKTMGQRCSAWRSSACASS